MERITTIIERNGGYVRFEDLIAEGIPTIYLSRYMQRHPVAKVVPGFYAEENWPYDEYLLFQYSYPRFVYSFASALYLHGLGDLMPAYFEVTGPSNYHPIKEKRDDVIIHMDTRSDRYILGVTEVETSLGNKVRVYDLEKTVCDLIRFRKNIESEVFLKALRAYSRRQDKSLSKLYEYAIIMGIEDKVMDLMEIIINED